MKLFSNRSKDNKAIVDSTLATMFLGNIANGFNLLISFFISRFASDDNILVLSSIIGLTTLIQIPTITIQNYITKQIAGKSEKNILEQKLQFNLFFSITAVIVMLGTFACRNVIAAFLNVSSSYTIYLGFIYFALILSALGRGYMYGYRNIKMVNVALVLETIFKFVMVTLSIFVTKEPTLAILGYCIPLFASSVVMIWYYTVEHNSSKEKDLTKTHINKLELAIIFANQLFLNLPFVIDIVLINYANRSDYYPLTVIGKVIYYAATILANNMISEVANEKDKDKRRYKLKLFIIISLAIGAVATIFTIFAKDLMVSFLAPGTDIADYIPIFSLSIIIFVFVYLIGQYLLLQDKKKQLALLFLTAAIQVLLYTYHNRTLGDAVINQLITYLVMLFLLLPLLLKKHYRRFTKVINPLLKKPLLAAGICTVIICILGYGFFYNKYTTVRTKVFIYGGGLGGSSAAIELSQEGINFVLAESSNWLGGQATTQGVSTFDQNGRSFQMNSVYESIISGLTTDNKDHIGEASVGYGAPASTINDRITSLINTDLGDIYLNSKLIKVVKDGDKILSVLIEQNGQTYQVIADYFFDSSDNLELTRLAGLSTRLGLDTQEETGETLALTSSQKTLFTSLFGNRVQAITAPATLLDKGYSGTMIDLGKLQPSGGSIITCTDHAKLSCLSIPAKSSAEFAVSIPYSGTWQLKLQTANDAVRPSELTISVLGKAFEAESGNSLSYSFDFSVAGSKTVKITNQADSAVSIAEINLVDPGSRSQAKSPGLTDLLAAAQVTVNESKAVIGSGNWTPSSVSQQREGDKYLVNNTKGASLSVSIPTNELITGNSYYLVATYSVHANRSKDAVYTISGPGMSTVSVNVDQTTDYFDNYIPILEFSKSTDPGDITVSVTNGSGGYTVVDAFIIVKASDLAQLSMLSVNHQVSLNAGESYNVYAFSDKNNPVILTGQDGTILLNKTTALQGYQYLGKITATATGKITTSNSSIPVIFARLNEAHYNETILKNFTQSDAGFSSVINSLSPGIFNVILDTTGIKGTGLYLKLTADDQTIFERSFNSESSVQDLGTLTAAGYTSISVTISGNCQSCEKAVLKLQEQQPDQDIYAHVVQEAASSNDYLKLLFSGDNDTDFFKFRQIVNAGNIFKIDLNSVGLTKSSLVSRNSIGITQINTTSNDYIVPASDLVSFLELNNAQNAVTAAAQKVTYAYYYWLKYDAPVSAYGCDYFNDDNCTGLRLSLLPYALGTSNGFGTIPYLRESYRAVGADTLTTKDFYLLEAAGCDPAKSACTSLTFGGKTYSIGTDFLNSYAQHPIASFYYPIDIHALTDQVTENDSLEAFDNTVSAQRNADTQPDFWEGYSEKKIKPYSISLEDTYSNDISNLMFCSHNFSVSQLANGSTREHPADSAVGQACAVTVETLYDNNLSQPSQLTTAHNYNLLLANLVSSRMYPLPLEDSQIKSLFRSKDSDIVLSYVFSIKEGFLNARLSQSPAYEFLVYEADPAGAADYQLAANALGMDSLSKKQAQYVTLQILGKLLDQESYDNLVATTKEYRCKLDSGKCDQEIAADDILTRGDFMYYIYKTYFD